MTQINQFIHSIPILTIKERFKEQSDCSPVITDLSLKQPIKVTGEICDEAIAQDILHNVSVNTIESVDTNIQPIKFDIGVDEVGRGPLYGSVVISAVILPHQLSGQIEQSLLSNTSLASLTDSKKLTEIKRQRLFPLLKQSALGYIIVEVPAAVIDELNILQATLTGMRVACEHLMVEFKHSINNLVLANTVSLGKTEIETSNQSHVHWVQYKLLIDGNQIPLFDWETLSKQGLGKSFGDKIVAEAWVKGDARHTAIAAASVLAKVTRDKQMIEDGLLYQGYGLEKHKGYPTKAHIKAIQDLGVLPEHRRSFKPIKQQLLEL